jgi:hypothetical protein
MLNECTYLTVYIDFNNAEDSVKQRVQWLKEPPHRGAALSKRRARRSSQTTSRTSRV